MTKKIKTPGTHHLMCVFFYLIISTSSSLIAQDIFPGVPTKGVDSTSFFHNSVLGTNKGFTGTAINAATNGTCKYNLQTHFKKHLLQNLLPT